MIRYLVTKKVKKNAISANAFGGSFREIVKPTL